MKKKRIILIVVLACLVTVVVGYAAFKNAHKTASPAKNSTKTVKQEKTKKADNKDKTDQSSKSSETATTKSSANNNSAQTNTSAQNTDTQQVKTVASDFYKAAYSKDFTKAKSLMTSDFASQFDKLLAGDDSQVNASVVRDISTYTNVSTPTSVEEPSAIEKNQDYQVTLKLGKSYEAKVSLKKDGSSYKVYAFSAQDSDLGEGGYAGSSMK